MSRKYGKSFEKLRQDHTVKVLMFTPLAGGWYNCNQTKEKMRRKQILAYLNQVIGGRTTVIKPGSGSPPRKQTGFKHPSKYRTKQR